MNKKMALTLSVLSAGGYFRKALERGYHGEKFATRLYTREGSVVKGVGFKAWEAMWESGVLKTRPCAKDSTWPTEWEMVERVFVTKEEREAFEEKTLASGGA